MKPRIAGLFSYAILFTKPEKQIDFCYKQKLSASYMTFAVLKDYKKER